MNRAELERLNAHANAGSDMASENHDLADEELHAAVLAYRHAADLLARVTADRLEVSSSVVDWEKGPDEDDPEAVALAQRLAMDLEIACDADLIFIAREVLDVSDGDHDAAYRRLKSRARKAGN